VITRRLCTVFVAVGLFLTAQTQPAQPARPAQSLRDLLSNETFRGMITDFSETGGSFQREWMSNEDSLQSIVPRLQQLAPSYGVYLGVGHEQNFTYIAALQPRIAFIFDIRRRNMVEQLVYKVLFEVAQDRADFLSKLVSKKRPASLYAYSTVDALFSAYAEVQPDRALYETTVASVLDHLSAVHGIELTDQDKRDVRDFLNLFFNAGPAVMNTATWPPESPPIPTYRDVMTARDSNNRQRSYLATEENFRIVQQLHRRNLIVPLVGDFAGDKALKRVGQYLKDNQATVTAFYLSNVESYLERPGLYEKFFSNVSALPTNNASLFIRSVTTATDRRNGTTVADQKTFFRSVIASIEETLKAFNAGGFTYRDAVLMSK
jgi:hypothetical protein